MRDSIEWQDDILNDFVNEVGHEVIQYNSLLELGDHGSQTENDNTHSSGSRSSHMDYVRAMREHMVDSLPSSYPYASTPEHIHNVFVHEDPQGQQTRGPSLSPLSYDGSELPIEPRAISMGEHGSYNVGNTALTLSQHLARSNGLSTEGIRGENNGENAPDSTPPRQILHQRSPPDHIVSPVTPSTYLGNQLAGQSLLSPQASRLSSNPGEPQSSEAFGMTLRNFREVTNTGDGRPSDPANGHTTHFIASSPTTDNSTPTKQRKRKRGKEKPIANGVNDKNNKGLRHFSLRVKETVERLQDTTYNQVADMLVAEIGELEKSSKSAAKEENGQASPDAASFDEKNIRRRVYDAINVLLALRIIKRDKKQIKWCGIHHEQDREEADRLQQEKDERKMKVQKLREHLEELKTQHQLLSSLLKRNSARTLDNNVSPDHFPMPIIVMQAAGRPKIDIRWAEESRKLEVDVMGARPIVHEEINLLRLLEQS